MYYKSYVPKEFKLHDIKDILSLVEIGTRHASKYNYCYINIERVWYVEFINKDKIIHSKFSIHNNVYDLRARPQQEISNIFRKKIFPHNIK